MSIEMSVEFLLKVSNFLKFYGSCCGCVDIDFLLWLGEVLVIVGELGLGKMILFNCLVICLELILGSVEY